MLEILILTYSILFALNWKNILKPFSLFILSWLLYIGIKLVYEFFNGREYNYLINRLIIVMSIFFLIGYLISTLLKSNHVKIKTYKYESKPIGNKLLIFSIIIFITFTIYLVLLGINVKQIANDTLTVRWLLGNGGNNFITQFFMVPLSVIPVIYFWNREKINLFKGIIIIFICFYYFYVLGIRGVIVDWVFSFIAINSFKTGKFNLPTKKILIFVFSAILIMSVLGISRYKSQKSNDTFEDKVEYSVVAELAVALFFERLDFLDVQNAYFNKVLTGNSELRLPGLPFIYMFLPRSIDKNKLYPTDTQVTIIAKDGYDQENITRIVGPIPELFYIGGTLAIAIWYFCIGFLFQILNSKISSVGVGTLFQKVYSKQLLQLGSLPLFFGINTIYGTQFILVTILSILTFLIIE